MSSAVVANAPVDFFTRQRQNRTRSIALIAAFLAFFLVLGLSLDSLWMGFGHGGSTFPIVTPIALGVSALLSWSAYFSGDRMVMASLLARPLDLTDPEHHQLHNIVNEVALASGLPRPRVMVIPDPAPNALAAGRDPQHAIIGVTQGLLQRLDREETQGVIAHEMAHIGNRDTLTMTVVGVLLGGALMLADWGRRTLRFSDQRRGGGIVALVVVLLVLLITPLLSRLLAMAVSRQREYLADATAVQFTRNPLGLAGALEKIAGVQSPLRGATRGTAHMFISNPWPRFADRHEGSMAKLLSTHPPIEQRIAILKAMAHSG